MCDCQAVVRPQGDAAWCGQGEPRIACYDMKCMRLWAVKEATRAPDEQMSLEQQCLEQQRRPKA